MSNLGFPYLIIHGANLLDWCERFDLEPFEAPCFICQQPLRVEIPFVTKDRRGLLSNVCPCGNKEIPFSYINLKEGLK